MQFRPLGGKDDSAGRAPHLVFLHQVHVAPPFQAYGNEAFIQDRGQRRIGVGLPDQPCAVRSAIHIKLQEQGPFL